MRELKRECRKEREIVGGRMEVVEWKEGEREREREREHREREKGGREKKKVSAWRESHPG